MTPFKTIVAASDLSAAATNAVRRAALLASEHGGELRIVHVVAPDGPGRLREWFALPQDVEARVAAAREQLGLLAAELSLRHELRATVEVRVGEAVAELHRAFDTADLLVVGQQRRNALSEWVLGGTVRRLLDRCQRPVLVVKRPAAGGYRKVLVPVELTPGSNHAAVAAARLAPRAALHVFHAFGSSGEVAMPVSGVREHVLRAGLAREEAGLLARMRRGIARLGLDPREVAFSIGRGSPIGATLQRAKDLRADLLAARKPRRAPTATSILGSVNGLLARTRCDMLIVPGGVSDPHVRDAAPPRSRAAGGRPAAQRAVQASAASRGAPRTATAGWRPPTSDAARSAGEACVASRV